MASGVVNEGKKRKLFTVYINAKDRRGRSERNLKKAVSPACPENGFTTYMYTKLQAYRRKR